MQDWLQFAVVISVQLGIFLVVAYRQGVSGRRLWRILGRSLLIGIPFGIGFDIIVGEYAGLFNYVLGVNPLFLLVNGLLSYGLMIATVSFWGTDSFVKFYGLIIPLATVYEVANFFFPVWFWTLPGDFLTQQVIVVLGGYFCLSFLMKVMLAAVNDWLGYEV